MICLVIEHIMSGFHVLRAMDMVNSYVRYVEAKDILRRLLPLIQEILAEIIMVTQITLIVINHLKNGTDAHLVLEPVIVEPARGLDIVPLEKTVIVVSVMEPVNVQVAEEKEDGIYKNVWFLLRNAYE